MLLLLFSMFIILVPTRDLSIGLIQPGQCLPNSYGYIRDWTNSSLPHITNPILYDSADHSCIDHQHLQSCDALRSEPMFQLPAELLSRHFSILCKFAPYFWLVIMCLSFHFTATMDALDPTKSAEVRHSLAYFSIGTGFLMALLMLFAAYGLKFINIESCEGSIVDNSEAAAFCSKLSSCGLTLASVFSSDWTTHYVYTSIAFAFGVFEVALHAFHLPFMLLHDWHTKRATQFEANRLAILSKQGDELTLALDTA